MPICWTAMVKPFHFTCAVKNYCMWKGQPGLVIINRDCAPSFIMYIIWVFPKMVGFPNNHGGLPTKNDHFGVWSGGTTILGNPHINYIQPTLLCQYKIPKVHPKKPKKPTHHAKTEGKTLANAENRTDLRASLALEHLGVLFFSGVVGFWGCHVFAVFASTNPGSS